MTADREYHRAWRNKHRQRIRAQQRAYGAKPETKAVRRAWESENRHRRHDYHLKQRFGISHADYLSLFRKQRGRCGICGGRSTRRWLDVDHCHVTKRVRGLLCNPCNRSLGHVEDWYRENQRRIDRWLSR